MTEVEYVKWDQEDTKYCVTDCYSVNYETSILSQHYDDVREMTKRYLFVGYKHNTTYTAEKNMTKKAIVFCLNSRNQKIRIKDEALIAATTVHPASIPSSLTDSGTIWAII